MQDPKETRLDANMARLATGDRAAFQPVFSELWPVVYRFCQKMLVNSGDAEDATQITLEKVFSQVSDYDSRRSAVAWVLSIAAWECRTFRRRTQRAREDQLEEALMPSSESSSPESLAIKRQLEQAVQSIAEQLSHSDQDTIRRAFTEGPGATGSVSGATFRKRKERALMRFRDLWRKVYGS